MPRFEEARKARKLIEEVLLRQLQSGWQCWLERRTFHPFSLSFGIEMPSRADDVSSIHGVEASSSRG
jgi:hypothetical protein